MKSRSGKTWRFYQINFFLGLTYLFLRIILSMYQLIIHRSFLHKLKRFPVRKNMYLRLYISIKTVRKCPKHPELWQYYVIWHNQVGAMNGLLSLPPAVLIIPQSSHLEGNRPTSGNTSRDQSNISTDCGKKAVLPIGKLRSEKNWAKSKR